MSANSRSPRGHSHRPGRPHQRPGGPDRRGQAEAHGRRAAQHGSPGADGALADTLLGMDGAGYGAYKSLRGVHELPLTCAPGQGSAATSASPGPTAPGSTHPLPTAPLTLSVDTVQSDPFAPPSLIQVSVPFAATGIDPALTRDVGITAVTDHLARRVAHAVRRHSPRGGKAAGALTVDAPGQEVLDRATVVLDRPAAGAAAGEAPGEAPGAAPASAAGDAHPAPVAVRVRLEAALPAHGRRIAGRAAAALLTGALPAVIEDALLTMDAADHADLAAAVALHRDQTALRSALAEEGLVGFVADGSILPRAAGDSPLPLADALPFTSPESLRRRFTLPSGREVTGMGVPQGVTLIVGGGYHGKSTLLTALEHGVYDHVAGDGREFALTVPDATSLRAEDGRAVTAVDVSPFIRDLPTGADTTRFTTTNASGSTSQAAAVMEALEAGATALLIDEDTSATNVMIRDPRMRDLVPTTKEPITPLVDRVRGLWEDLGVSTVLVAGGSGAFIDVADTVIMLDAYRPSDITDRARALAQPVEALAPVALPAPRVPARGGLDAGGRGAGGHHSGGRSAGGHHSGEHGADGRHSGGHGADNRHSGGHRGRPPKPPQAKGLRTIRHGDEFIDLAAVSQLVDASQTRAVAAVLAELARAADGRTPLRDLVTAVLDRAAREGVDALSPYGGRGDGTGRPAHPGRLAVPRVHEVMAAVNRYRLLRMA
ncbi:ABC-ATPase domain-containing protein [Corynebacterium bovis]|uniref:ABC-ATPase domain-containing protein n=1 Tax=Corynebacterium bovis TaxID=36808 RepID=UPI00244D174C|nr:ABC-ATPase domain-containing protein [Corynebacterium bovis]MDH2456099.1 ABC-ATPase domain-containing protein [Corynebacterium bovis]